MKAISVNKPCMPDKEVNYNDWTEFIRDQQYQLYRKMNPKVKRKYKKKAA